MPRAMGNVELATKRFPNGNYNVICQPFKTRNKKRRKCAPSRACGAVSGCGVTVLWISCESGGFSHAQRWSSCTARPGKTAVGCVADMKELIAFGERKNL